MVGILVELAFIRELSFFHPLYVRRGLGHDPGPASWAVRLDLGVEAISLVQELRGRDRGPATVLGPLLRSADATFAGVATDEEVTAALPGDDATMANLDWGDTRDTADAYGLYLN